VQTVKKRSVTFLFCFSLFALVGAAPQHAVAAPQQAEQEGSLLHRRLPLHQLESWSRSQASWAPFVVSPAKLYVVNLWSPHCQPCVNEFPTFRKLVEGWRNNPAVKFLFLADPPGDTSRQEIAAFWLRSLRALPAVDPVRTTTAELRQSLETELMPITLLVDEQLVVRQAFVGGIGTRSIGTAIERMLRTSSAQVPQGTRHARNP
jgi:thiol-disulfide isomerase/thioredoxin